MGISSYPLNLNTSNLKLVAASSLSSAHTPAAKPDSSRVSQNKSLPENSNKLSDAALMEISKLKARDAQLRQHEQAHLAASTGVDVSRASFTYQRGPNGVSYAVAGDVTIDTSPGRTPADALARADMIRDVALAPIDPSATDRRVAVQAQQMAQQARIEIQQQASNPGNNQTAQLAEINRSHDNGSAAKKIDTYA